MIIGKRYEIVLEPIEENFIRDYFAVLTNQQLADCVGLRLTRLRMFTAKMGLKRMTLEFWSKDQVKFLKDNYKHIGDSELVDMFTNK